MITNTVLGFPTINMQYKLMDTPPRDLPRPLFHCKYRQKVLSMDDNFSLLFMADGSHVSLQRRAYSCPL